MLLKSSFVLCCSLGYQRLLQSGSMQQSRGERLVCIRTALGLYLGWMDKSISSSDPNPTLNEACNEAATNLQVGQRSFTGVMGKII